MNIYGDRGNILTLQKRAEWRGITVVIDAIGRGPAPDLSDVDLVFWGGGQDPDQELVFKEAAEHKVGAIPRAVDGGAVALAGCRGCPLGGASRGPERSAAAGGARSGQVTAGGMWQDMGGWLKGGRDGTSGLGSAAHQSWAARPLGAIDRCVPPETASR